MEQKVLTTESDCAIVIIENKRHGSIRERQLPYACAGDATTYTTDLRPHRSISIPFLRLLFKGNSLVARGDGLCPNLNFRHRVGHKTCTVFSVFNLKKTGGNRNDRKSFSHHSGCSELSEYQSVRSI
jgi:hypothetical protein